MSDIAVEDRLIPEDILNQIVSVFFNKAPKFFVDKAWFRPDGPGLSWRLERRVASDQAERTLEVKSILNTPQRVGDIESKILSYLATFCFNCVQKSRGFGFRKGAVDITGLRKFETVLHQIVSKGHKLKKKSQEEFLESYSWTLVDCRNYDHLGYYPVIYYNPVKLKEEKKKGDYYVPYRKIAWVLHEIAHIILHWKDYFEKEIFVSIRSKPEGKRLEREAWKGACQLLRVLADCDLVREFHEKPDLLRTVLEQIFIVYLVKDTDGEDNDVRQWFEEWFLGDESIKDNP